MKPTIWRAAIGLALLGACASLPHPTPPDVERAAGRWPGVTAAQLEDDRRRYVAKCSSCHMLRSPGRYTEEHWMRTMEKMADRARLSSDDREAILRYLTVFARPPAIASAR